MRVRPDAEQIVGMRRLTEAQYRNSIADIFGPEITVSGRFEPIVRPPRQLLAAGATDAAISPAGLEQFDAIARGIAEQVFGERYRARFVSCTPTRSARAEAACAQSTLVPMGRYLFRRPLTEEERELYLAIAAKATSQTGSFDHGLKLALSAMLVSPNFLYMVDRGHADPQAPGIIRLDGYSRAARLSYFLWNTTPNDSLLDAAANGDLADAGKLNSTVRKMVASPRLKDGVRAFFADMLIYENFENLSKDPVIFPRFSAEVAKLLPEQMLRTIVGFLVDERGSYKDLFTTRDTYMARPLGAVYGVPVHVSNGWEPYTLPPDSRRVGLLGQAAFLALYSHSGRSSPTIRGRAIREVLLCQPVPDPPGNVDFKIVQDTSNPLYHTARARLDAHRTNPVCAGCHSIVDPIGLSLENFDGIGRYRAQENGADIDPAGKLGRDTFVGLSGLGQELATIPATTNCLVGRVVEYATGRPAGSSGADIQNIEQGFAADGYHIQTLFQQVATASTYYEVRPPANVKTALAN
jgi:hypothetical protein